jgi:pimeloyl-ACP methyl ester carboxylesterase
MGVNLATGSRSAGRPARRAGLPLRRAFAVLAATLVELLLAGYFGISAYVADKLSRPARNPATHTPGDYGLPYEDVQFPSARDHIPLRGWFIPAPGTRTVILLHGRDFSREANGGLEKAAALAHHGYNVLMFDFRGHGTSGGDRYSLGLWETRDVDGALAYLRRRSITETGIYGVSMGAATAIIAAAAHPEIKAVVAESAYAELSLLINDAFAARSGLPVFFNLGVRLAARLLYGMDFAQARPAVALRGMGDRPILLIHSTTDEFVPVRHAIRLQQAGAGNPNLDVWIVPQAGHCEAFSTYKDEYTRRMLAFYDRYLP